MASSKTFEDLDLSREEIKRIETALKDEKFRKMFIEYAEEISNPENRRIYEEEIAMLENERGMDVQFVNPEPGHVLKTTVTGGKKAFINICTSDKVGKPTSKKEQQEGKKGLHWQIPHSFSPPREDFDKTKKTCMVYDVVFHPDTYRMTSNPQFLKLVEDTAVEGIERQFDVKLDRNNIRRPKMKCKGKPVATVIRNRKDDANKFDSKRDENDPLLSMPYPYPDKTSSELAEEKNKKSEKKASKDSKTKSNNLIKEESGYTTPSYTVTHRSNLDLQEFRNAPDSRPTTRPKELIVNVELPLCKSAAGVDLDIFEDKLSLKSEKPAYKLEFKLPYPVDDENGSARFDKSKKSLIITLPVLAGEIPEIPSFLDSKNQNETDIPSLITELPPLEEVNNSADGMEDELPVLEEISTEHKPMEYKLSKSPFEVNKTKISYSLPDFDFTQDQETVTFVFHVHNISDESVCKSFPCQGSCEIKFVSVGSGGFPMHYRFLSSFGEDCKLVPEHCTVDISDRNLTFTLLKKKDSRTIWNKFLAGVDEENMEEKVFVTSGNLQEELDQLQQEGENMGQTDEHAPEPHAANIKVVEMNEKRLTLNIRKPTVSFSEEEEEGYDGEDSPQSAGIEVVHSQKPPNLHGILKQRSMSESSEDHLSLSSDSPTACSPRDSDGSSCRRSVTFNSHIDQTTFKTNATVTSMKQALKSKRKRHRKREEKKKEREGRRRHNSNGSECSSCDEHDTRHSSESHSEEDPETEDLAQQLQDTGKKVEDCGVIIEDQEDIDEKHETEESAGGESDDISKKPGYQIHSESEDKSRKFAAEVKSNMEKMKAGTGDDNDSDDDVGDDNEVERTNKKESKSVIVKEENKQKKVDLTSSKFENEKSNASDLSMAVNGKTPVMAANDDSGEINNTGDMKSAIKENKSGKGSQKGVKFKEDVKENKAEGKDGDKKPEIEDIVETELSWNDGNKSSLFNEHRTQCAFNFSNNVMFDLDID